MFKINKKSQISETLTWFFAFCIIFLMMIIFMAATMGMSAIKKVSYGKDEITLENSNSIKTSETLFSILNNNIDYKNQKIKIRDLIESYYYSNNKTEVSSILNNKLNEIFKNNNQCYLFSAEYMNKMNVIDSLKFDNTNYDDSNKNKLLDKTYSLMLIANNKESIDKFRIRLYSGECNEN